MRIEESTSVFGLGQEEEKKAVEEALKTGNKIVGGIEVMSAKVVGADGNPVLGAEVIVQADGKLVAKIDASNGYYVGERLSFDQPTSDWKALITAPGLIPISAPVCNTSPDGKAWFPWTCGVMDSPLILKLDGKSNLPFILGAVGAAVVVGLISYFIGRASVRGHSA